MKHSVLYVVKKVFKNIFSLKCRNNVNIPIDFHDSIIIYSILNVFIIFRWMTLLLSLFQCKVFGRCKKNKIIKSLKKSFFMLVIIRNKLLFIDVKSSAS
jgi:hypothetical protein